MRYSLYHTATELNILNNYMEPEGISNVKSFI